MSLTSSVMRPFTDKAFEGQAASVYLMTLRENHDKRMHFFEAGPAHSLFSCVKLPSIFPEISI